MQSLHFKIVIEAPVQHVYERMLGKETYQQWTSEFSPTSRYAGNWEKDSKMIFLSNEADGSACGMISRVRENQWGSFVSLEHLGLYEGGREIMEGEKVDPFKGALEEYTFLETEKGTLVKIRMDFIPEWEVYFLETWPKALKHLKKICEQ